MLFCAVHWFVSIYVDELYKKQFYYIVVTLYVLFCVCVCFFPSAVYFFFYFFFEKSIDSTLFSFLVKLSGFTAALVLIFYPLLFEQVLLDLVKCVHDVCPIFKL